MLFSRQNTVTHYETIGNNIWILRNGRSKQHKIIPLLLSWNDPWIVECFTFFISLASVIDKSCPFSLFAVAVEKKEPFKIVKHQRAICRLDLDIKSSHSNYGHNVKLFEVFYYLFSFKVTVCWFWKREPHTVLCKWNVLWSLKSKLMLDMPLMLAQVHNCMFSCHVKFLRILSSKILNNELKKFLGVHFPQKSEITASFTYYSFLISLFHVNL